jgi:hypothetical protein
VALRQRTCDGKRPVEHGGKTKKPRLVQPGLLVDVQPHPARDLRCKGLERFALLPAELEGGVCDVVPDKVRPPSPGRNQSADFPPRNDRTSAASLLGFTSPMAAAI